MGAVPAPEWEPEQVHSEVPVRAWRDNVPGILLALRIYRRTLVATILLVPLCTWIVLRQATPLYTATGALVYQASEYQSRELQSMIRSEAVTDAVMATQAEALQSLGIAEQVAQRGRLFENPAFNLALQPPGILASWVGVVRTLLGMEDDAPPPEPVYGPVLDPNYNATLQVVRSALHASPVRFSHAIEVSFVAPDPAVAAVAVNNAMDAYIKGLYAAKYKKVGDGTAHLQAQERDLEKQIANEEKRIDAYRTVHPLSQGIHDATPREQISRLTEDLIRAKADQAGAASRLEAAKGRGADADIAPPVVALRARVAQLAERIQAQKSRLGPDHPEAQAAARQYAEAERALAAEVAHATAAIEAEFRAASDRVAALQRNLDEAQLAADRWNRDQFPLNDLLRDLEAKRQQLTAVQAEIDKTANQTAIEFPEAHEINQALPPGQPSSPRKLQTMLAASAASVFLALILVQIMQMMDDTLRSGDAIRNLTNLPCLALIPEVTRRALGNLRVHDYVARRPLTAFAEQVRCVRASLCLKPGHPKVITITSARPSDGKTIFTLSLARSAQLGNIRVLAVECDVRQSSFQQRLGGQAQVGLLDVLRGELGWRDTVQLDRMTGMAFIAAGRPGKPGGDVLSLFLSERMRVLLNELREHYDLILLDAPPVEAMTEARIIASLSEATLLCVRWHRTQAKTLMHAIGLLRDVHAKIIGTVLTRVDTREHLRSGNADAGVYHRRYRAYFRG